MNASASERVIALRPERGPFSPFAGAAAFALVAALAVLSLARLPLVSGDTVALVQGSGAALQCIDRGQFTDCPGIPQFEPLQFIPAIVLKWLEFTDDDVLRVLALLNLASFLALCGIAWRAPRRVGADGLAPLLFLIIATSPLAFYSASTFSEALAAMAIVLFAAGLAIRPRTWVLVCLAVVATITKESTFPFVATLAAASALAAPSRERARVVVATAVGIAFGLMLHGMLNLFRYGSPINQVRLNDDYRVHDAALAARFAAALWVSPNAGAAWFWPGAALVVVAVALCLVALLRKTRDRTTLLSRAAPLGAPLVVVAALTFMLAQWYAPFGWLAWGPRLSVPLLCGAVVYAVLGSEELANVAARWLRQPALVAAIVVVLLAGAVPQVMALVAPVRTTSLFHPDETCPHEVAIESGAPYYRCLEHAAWEKKPVLLFVARAAGHGNAGPFFLALTAGAALAVGTETVARARRSGNNTSECT